MEELIRFSENDWLHILRDNRIDPPENIPGGDPLLAYAQQLKDAVARKFPTSSFLHGLKTETNKDVYKEAVHHLGRFLENQPEVKPDHSNIDLRSLGPDERQVIIQQLNSVSQLAALYPGLNLKTILSDKTIGTEEKANRIEALINKLDTFSSNNQGIDFITADFYAGTYVRPGTDEHINISWEGIDDDQNAVISQLKTYQRVLRITPRYESARTLLLAGLDSARKITLNSRQDFLQLFPGDQVEGTILFNNALAIAETSTLVWLNAQETLGSSLAAGTLFDNTSPDLIDYFKTIPGYQDLFELPKFCECEDCKSIFGPAAYFVDLMRFIDLHVGGDARNDIRPGLSLKERRPDLWRIPLDCEHTNQTSSYLDIVNEVLEERLRIVHNQNNPYQSLLRVHHPFNVVTERVYHSAANLKIPGPCKIHRPSTKP